MVKNIIIVGAGISGLSAGCYAQMNGYNASILEMHTIPGGLCTAWECKGYKWDISMHMLTASVSGPLHKMWEELGIAANFKFHYHNHIAQVEGMGKKLVLSTDRDKLERDMLAISQDDERLIKEFIRIIFGPDMMKAASLKPKKLKNLVDTLNVIPVVLPLLGTFIRYKGVTLQQFASRFKDPFLREAVRFVVDTPGWPMLQFPMAVMAGFVKSSVSEAGAPLGGSQQVVFHMAELFKNLGGEIRYKSHVKDLILEKSVVKGVRLSDGSEQRADEVIWAGDGHSLIFDILGGKYMDDRLKNMYENWIPVRPIVHVMVGVNRDMSAEPHRLMMELDDPVTIAAREHHWISVLHHCFDLSMAPAGKSAVEVWYDTEYEYWEDLATRRKEYKAEKKRIADITIALLEKRWPGFASQVEVVDVPTPATYKRYTGNWKGSPDGWYVTTENMNAMEPVRTLPGIEGLQMVGQWTAPFTGTVIAAMTGRQVIELMCRRDGRRFMTQFAK